MAEYGQSGCRASSAVRVTHARTALSPTRSVSFVGMVAFAPPTATNFSVAGRKTLQSLSPFQRAKERPQLCDDSLRVDPTGGDVLVHRLPGRANVGAVDAPNSNRFAEAVQRFAVDLVDRDSYPISIRDGSASFSVKEPSSPRQLLSVDHDGDHSKGGE